MSRTRRSDLDALVALVNNETRTADYELSIMAGTYRLVRDGGSREVSPRLPAGQMEDWLRAFFLGLLTERAPTTSEDFAEYLSTHRGNDPKTGIAYND